VGVSGGSTAPPDASLAGIGVAGISDRGFGVSGRSTFTSGVDGGSTSGIGVSGRSVSQSGVEGNSTTGAGTVGASDSGVGVAGHSTHAVGGRFSSTDVAQIQLTPHSGNLEDPNGSIPGTIGDLIVLSAKRGAQMVATLWFCRIAGDGATANWAQLA
jgi:hypothetical protein